MPQVKISFLEKWTVFMIRALLVIPFLFSCASLDYSELYDLARLSIIGADDIPIDQDLINKTRYSFVKVKIGKSRVAIMPLSSINNNIYKWVGRDATIYTKKGKIIKTLGLDHNIDIIENKDDTAVIMLKNPNALITQRFISSTTETTNKKFVEIKESFYTENFKWKGENFYLMDNKSGLYYKSTQTNHPRLEELSLELVYIF